jgi:hypothetical protein
MKAKIIFHYQNEEEVERNENLGIPAPEPTEFEGDLYFNPEFVHAAYINHEGHIVVYLPSGYWILEYDDKTWDTIKGYLT